MDSIFCQNFALSTSLISPSPSSSSRQQQQQQCPRLRRGRTPWVVRYWHVYGAVDNVRVAQRSQFFGDERLLSLPLTPTVPYRKRQLSVCVMVLPTANPERVADKSIPKWSARAIKAFSMAELEARKLKYSTTGTEALLMGILTEGTSQAARFLRSIGVTLFQVRDEAIKILGKGDMYYFSPEHPPITEPAQKALDWAITEKQRIGDSGEIPVSLLLLGIWEQRGSAGQQILATLGFDEKKAKELAKLVEDGASF